MKRVGEIRSIAKFIRICATRQTTTISATHSHIKMPPKQTHHPLKYQLPPSLRLQMVDAAASTICKSGGDACWWVGW
jgi:hypothetical protein